VQKLKFLKNKKILITGGGGYLGSKLAEKIASYQTTIYLCDIKFNPISQNLSEKYSNVHTIRVDLTNKEKISKVCVQLKPDYIYHFASLLNRERDFSTYPTLYKINVQGTLNLLEALNSVDYTGFFFSSTSEVYGNKNKSPFVESQTPDPISPYSLTKIIAEYTIKTYSEIHCKPFTILRLFNIFGIDMPNSFFINLLINKLNCNEIFEMTGGNQKRDFIHISDLLSIIISISKTKKSIGETVNICSGTGIRINDLAIKIAKRLKKEHLLKIGVLPYRHNEVWEMVGDPTKLSSFYGLSKVKSIAAIMNNLKIKDEY